jgi:2-keto-3-deoxy-L-rhamnonate aldolase RhmA
MNGSELAQALRAGDRVYGTCVLSPAPQWPSMIASAGLDFVFLDTEHVVLDRNELSWMCQAYTGHGLAPIIRIPSPDPYRACQMIDGGAAGVIAPYLESVDQVQQHRGAVKLRPLKGQRLQRVLAGEEQLDDTLQQYLDNYNKNNVCIINIESVPALEALDDIVAVPGVDALLVGPHDLSINLGIPEQYSHPLFEEAIQTIIKTGRSAGLGVGIHFSDGMDPMIGWAKSGMNLILHSSDKQIVSENLKADINRFHTELGDTREGGGDVQETTI